MLGAEKEKVRTVECGRRRVAIRGWMWTTGAPGLEQGCRQILAKTVTTSETTFEKVVIALFSTAYVTSKNDIRRKRGTPHE